MKIAIRDMMKHDNITLGDVEDGLIIEVASTVHARIHDGVLFVSCDAEASPKAVGMSVVQEVVQHTGAALKFEAVLDSPDYPSGKEVIALLS